MSGIFPTLFFKGGIFIQSNIIYNFDDLRTLISSKTQKGAYYLLHDDLYFEEITRHKILTRDVYTIAQKVSTPLNVIKYISFKVKDSYTTKQIYELIQILRKDTTIIITFFNPKNKEVLLLFVSNKDDSLLRQHIKKFIELEV